MIIREHTTTNTGSDIHHYLVIEWFGREWKVILNEIHTKKSTTAHLLDDGWRQFDMLNHMEKYIYYSIQNSKSIKLKYKVQ